MLPRSARLTTPVTSSPTRSFHASTTCWRSASRTRWTMTCLAAWAAMRPNSGFSICSSIQSPTSTPSASSTASISRIWRSGDSITTSSATTSQRRKVS